MQTGVKSDAEAARVTERTESLQYQLLLRAANTDLLNTNLNSVINNTQPNPVGRET